MQRSAEIIAFHSYQGGGGTSMTLANTAWLLASAGKRVLVVDWDLQAPALHRYLRPFLTDPELESTEGLMESALAFSENVADAPECVVSLDWDFASGGSLDLLPAGRQGPAYSVHVTGFDWRGFASSKAGARFYDWLERQLPVEYDYVLIDTSSGIRESTALSCFRLPHTLCLCLTLNRTNIEGTRQLAALSRSDRSDRPPRIFPIVGRVDLAEKMLLDDRRAWARDTLDPFLDHLGDAKARQQYFREVEVPYVPFHSYGEVLPVFMDRPADAHSISATHERLCAYLTKDAGLEFTYPDPSRREEVLGRWRDR